MANDLKEKAGFVALKNIVNVLKDNNLSKIVYESDGIKIEAVNTGQEQCIIANNNNDVYKQKQVNTFQQSDIKPINDTADLSKHAGAVKSPMVGTCYLAPEPGAKKFVEIGDNVKKGQPLLIIEAMKVMNYIRAKNDGKVINILVQDAQPVEYGQLLLVIE